MLRNLGPAGDEAATLCDQHKGGGEFLAKGVLPDLCSHFHEPWGQMNLSNRPLPSCVQGYHQERAFEVKLGQEAGYTVSHFSIVNFSK